MAAPVAGSSGKVCTSSRTRIIMRSVVGGGDLILLLDSTWYIMVDNCELLAQTFTTTTGFSPIVHNHPTGQPVEKICTGTRYVRANARF